MSTAIICIILVLIGIVGVDVYKRQPRKRISAEKKKRKSESLQPRLLSRRILSTWMQEPQQLIC